MDIKHFSYFVTIVECGCNLSAAAKKIHISQSALSKIILTFEQEENVQLFVRSGGRLSRLTSAGRLFYSACLDISGRYERMLEQLRQESLKYRGEVRVGIPPLVLTVVFSGVITQFKVRYPNIDLVIIEAGAEELRQKLLNCEIDFAVLLAPSGLEHPAANEYALDRDVLSAFVSADSPLAQKECMEWSDLDGRNIAIFNETFSIHRLLMERFRREKIKPVVALMSASWDFLLETVQNSDFVTILPAPILDYANVNKVTSIPFADPVVWEVIMVERGGEKHARPQEVFKEYVLRHFGGQKR